jgi:hypothetical protein
MAPTSLARAVYVIACHMIERHGDRTDDVLERFVAANQSQEDIEAKALWADVRVAVRVLTSEAARPHTVSSSRSRMRGSSATSGY